MLDVHHDLGMEVNYQAYMAGNPLDGGPPGRNRGWQVSGGPYRPEGFEDYGGPGGPPGGDGHKGGPPPRGAGPKERSAPVGGSSAGMSIHKSEGLVPINADGASTIPGLYAAGDTLGSYMAGAIYTQIGSSLAGSAVQGGIAAEAAAAYAHGLAMPAIPDNKRLNIREEILAPMKRKRGYGPAWVTQTLQGIMIPNFGSLR